MVTLLPTPEEMSRWDRLTIDEFGLSGQILMENASRAALYALKKEFGPLRDASVMVFAGPGNNGGDAFALARHLVNLGATVLILHAKHLAQYTHDSAYHLKLAMDMGIPCSYLPEYEMDLVPRIDIVVDGLLGTGFEGPLRPNMQGWIKSINKLGVHSHVLSLDIPSGLNGTTGQPMPIAVEADMTVTFEEAKLGLFLPPAKAHVGKLVTSKIGIPRHIKDRHPTAHIALGPDLANLLPEPGSTMHKGEAGHILVLGGSPGLTGAPMLAARAAFRSGAGLVSIACPKALTPAYGSFPEVMTLGLGNSDQWSSECFDSLQPQLARFSAVVFGPGFGRSDGAMAFLERYLANPHAKTLYDADALFLLAQRPDLLALVGQDAVLTPHPGEMANFFGVTAGAINLARARYAREFSFGHRVNLVLKGAATIVAGHEDPIAISPFCAPNLAIAGSGDVLSGIIGSLVAQGHPPLTAARIGVYWHGYAGTQLANDFPYRGNTPMEIADHLPTALKEWKKCVQLKIS
ncbi:NAD(P)H-hydrate epimerase [Desulfomicrobium norvegicum]|uniref:Bifunctional NAD(P)H-hydrate repair enzyme n=1 Tax=Desulfomicrobium norvegicum (strain DSM 1741 / NCIMB 8310) TaxID=52561 RepID=A0A8G2C235_DESNO|nr:NAD(P)H-hydrate dehydratase [Desulfomicrobium norvegicum]SFL61269.1 NAD(P)H-hydrate epimerase [Desulfomicrobium norvegicum]